VRHEGLLHKLILRRVRRCRLGYGLKRPLLFFLTQERYKHRLELPVEKRQRLRKLGLILKGPSTIPTDTLQALSGR
jgi:hypothetical protein